MLRSLGIASLPVYRGPNTVINISAQMGEKMSRFNLKQEKTTTYEGGRAQEKTLEQEWTNMIFSSFLQDGFYENQEDYTKRMINLNDKIIAKYGPQFASKAMDYVRNQLGMRTTSALLAAQLNGKSFEDKRTAFSHYFHRPDDVSEVFAAIDSIGGKRSHALIRGAADYLSGLSEYSLGKYKMRGHQYNMYDLINLTHAHSDAIQKYKDGRLDAPETWEVKISTAADDDERAKNWRELVIEGKLGYLALIRNIRNYASTLDYDEIKKYLVPQLTNKIAIKKSLVFPYQIYNAYKAVRLDNERRKNIWSWEYYNRNLRDHMEFDDPLGEKKTRLIVNALNNAFIYSIDNVPALDGDNCVIVDVSGSMDDDWSPTLTINEVCSVYAAAMVLNNPLNTKVIKFGTDAKVFNHVEAISQIDNVFELIFLLRQNDDLGYGTDISAVMPFMNEHYDSIFLFSDMQVMDGSNRWNYHYDYRDYENGSEFGDYFHKFGPVSVFSFDLGNYHNRVQTGYDNIYPITALSANVFDFINLVKQGKTLIDVIIDS